MAAPRPGNTDRGWNDPPIFDYGSAPAAAAAPKKTLLNKRVAYPMSGGDPAGGGLCTGTLLNPEAGPPKLGDVQILPPAPNASAPTPVPVLVPNLPGSPPPQGHAEPPHFPSQPPHLSDEIARLGLADEDQYRKHVLHLLQLCLEKHQASLSARTAEEVKKKLAALEETWVEGKMSEPVKVQLGRLVTALEKGNIDEADKLHVSLMVDHTAEVHHWMVGIKHLVQEAKLSLQASQAPQPTEPSSSEETEPTIPMFDRPPGEDAQPSPTLPPAASAEAGSQETETPTDS